MARNFETDRDVFQEEQDAREYFAELKFDNKKCCICGCSTHKDDLTNDTCYECFNMNTNPKTNKIRTMKTIKLKLTERKVVETEISLPYFCKHNDYFYCILDEINIIIVLTNPHASCVRKTKLLFYETELFNAEQITEAEFIEAYKTAKLILDSHVFETNTKTEEI